MIGAVLVVLALAIDNATAATGVYRPTGPTNQKHVRDPSIPCSSTAFGPEFPYGPQYKPTGWMLSYGGGASCAGGVGLKKVVVHAEVLGQDGHTWYEITGSRIVGGPSYANPVRAFASRPAYLGHVYRVVNTAVFTFPLYRHVQTIYITAVTKGYAP